MSLEHKGEKEHEYYFIIIKMHEYYLAVNQDIAYIYKTVTINIWNENRISFKEGIAY